MSSDEILAASLWAWPDPVVKRDKTGAVIFVNAAFLQFYGGQDTDWAGKLIPNWPDVVSTGAQRFETRHGDENMAVAFDWVETILSDGHALVIARNINQYVEQINALQMQQKQAQPVAPVLNPAIAENAVTENIVPATENVPKQQVSENQVLEKTVPESPELENTELENTAPDSSVGENTVPENIEPVFETESELEAPDLDADIEQTLDNTAEDYAYEDNKQAQAVVEEVVDKVAPAEQPVAAQVNKSEEKIIQKRALPIEDSTSVLGSNWRDQVIAKAVGADVDDIKEAKAERNIADEESKGDDQKMATGLQILLAEDNAINALLTRTLLEADGAIVDVVEDGALALEAVKKKDYDLIFMDMRMPNMDGLEATRKIRAWGYTKPIVALTANAFDDDRNACFDSGMNDFMTKPVSAEELNEMVATWMKKSEDRKIAS